MNAMRPGLPDPLLKLLGAAWAMGAPVAGAAWLGPNCAGFGLADGTVAIAQAGWDGAARVQARPGGGVELVPASTPPPPVMRVGVHAGPSVAVASDPSGGLQSSGSDGLLMRVSADGTTRALAALSEAPAAHLATAANGLRAWACGARVHRDGVAGGVAELPGPVTALAVDVAGGRLSVGCADALAIWETGRESPDMLAWSGPVPSLSFSGPGGFLAAAGGARVACLQSGRRSEAGIGSSVPVTRVACHPSRPLIAAGYANGAVLLCQPDRTDTLFVRSAGGGAVSALAWSPDGKCLALGAEGGEIGVVAFPELLFRADAPAPATAAQVA